MNKKAIRMVSALLAISMMLPVAACGKKKTNGKEKRSGQKITADTPWFDCNSYVVDIPIDKSKKLFVLEQQPLDCDEKRIIVKTSGEYETSADEADFLSWNGHDNDIAVVTVIDRTTGNTINTIDLRAGMGTSDNIESVAASNGKINIKFSSTVETRPDCFETLFFERIIDADIGEVVSTSDSVSDESVTLKYNLGSYQIEATNFYYEETQTGGFLLLVTAPDGKTTNVELKENGHIISNIDFIALENSTTAIIPSTKDSEVCFYRLDLKSLTVTQADPKDYNWLNTYYVDFIGTDGCAYCSTKTGIYKLNFAAKQPEEFFNYSNCGINRNFLVESDLVDINGNTFVFASRPGAYGSMEDKAEPEPMEIFIFTKSEKNPHEGKTILELYEGSDYVTSTVSDAIIEFNNRNKEYYIEVTDRYDQSYEEFNAASNPDESYMALLNMNAMKSTQLAADLINGEGPDILLNTASLSQLNNDKYLADLSPYIGNPDQSKYFTNVIDAFRVDGKLYNFPINYSIDCIQTRSDFQVASGIGFTTSEYENFLNGTLNGSDVLIYGQTYYFSMLFDSMREKFIANGKADFTCPEFTELAKFVNENVPEKSDMNNNYDEEYFMDIGTMHTTCYSASDYLYYYVILNGADRILGTPSTDGRGPSVSANSSVAISAHAQNLDACGEFVKTFMRDDVQAKEAQQANFVLSREAFRQASKASLDLVNNERYLDAIPGVDYKRFANTFSEKNIDDLEKIILTCSRSKSEDAAISIVLIEEMPAYFLGQKDLASVSKIAQDRAQKILDERK